MRQKTSHGIVPSATRGGATRFDYTEIQWKKIEVLFPSRERSTSLEEARERLRNAAQEYLSGGLLQRGDRARKNRWERITRLSKKLHSELSSCAEGTFGQDMPRPFCDLLSCIGGLPRYSELAAHDCAGRGKVLPRWIYQLKVLQVWVHLGGQVRISRHSRSQKVQGPLARYFLAVAEPVMGDATPSLESLREIIERWVVTRGWFFSLLSHIAKDPGIFSSQEAGIFSIRIIYNWLYERRVDMKGIVASDTAGDFEALRMIELSGLLESGSRLKLMHEFDPDVEAILFTPLSTPGGGFAWDQKRAEFAFLRETKGQSQSG
jgi:hypothetical protein